MAEKAKYTKNTSDSLPKPNEKVGGYLVGQQNGQTVLHEDGNKGGLFVGRSHAEKGGIQALNTSTNQDLLVEGMEFQVNPKSVQDTSLKHTLGNDKNLTNKQVLSKINQEGGGVPILANGGVVDKTEGKPIELPASSVIINKRSTQNPDKKMFDGKMRTNLEILSIINESNGGLTLDKIPNNAEIRVSGKKFAYGDGGQMVADHDIVSSCGCKHSMAKGGVSEGEDYKALAAKEFEEAQKEYFKGNYGAQNKHLEKAYEYEMLALSEDKEKFNELYNNPEVTVLYVGGDGNTLSRQLTKLTGDSYNGMDFDGSIGFGEVLIHNKSGKKFTVLNVSQKELLEKIGKESFASGGQTGDDEQAVINKALEVFSKETGVHLDMSDFELKNKYDTADYYQGVFLRPDEIAKIQEAQDRLEGRHSGDMMIDKGHRNVCLEMIVNKDYLWSSSKYSVSISFAKIEPNSKQTQNIMIYPYKNGQAKFERGGLTAKYASGGDIEATDIVLKDDGTWFEASDHDIKNAIHPHEGLSAYERQEMFPQYAEGGEINDSPLVRHTFNVVIGGLWDKINFEERLNLLNAWSPVPNDEQAILYASSDFSSLPSGIKERLFAGFAKKRDISAKDKKEIVRALNKPRKPYQLADGGELGNYKYQVGQILTDTDEKHEVNSKLFGGKRHYYVVVKQTKDKYGTREGYVDYKAYWVDAFLGDGDKFIGTGSFKVDEKSVVPAKVSKEDVDKVIANYIKTITAGVSIGSPSISRGATLDAIREFYGDKAYGKGGKTKNSEQVTGVNWGNPWANNKDVRVLRISYGGNDYLDIISLDDNGKSLYSDWVKADHFKRGLHGKYNENEIREEVIRLLKEGDLDSIREEGVNSDALKTKKIGDNFTNTVKTDFRHPSAPEVIRTFAAGGSMDESIEQERRRLNQIVDDADSRLKMFIKNNNATHENGLMKDEFRKSPEYIKLSRDFKIAFNNLRDFNGKNKRKYEPNYLLHRNKFSSGGSMDDSDYEEVESVKWGFPYEKNKNIVTLRITTPMSGESNSYLDLIALGNQDRWLLSNWVKSDYFNKPEFKINDRKYDRDKIREHVIGLLKHGDLESIKKDDLKSSALKFKKIFDKVPAKISVKHPIDYFADQFGIDKAELSKFVDYVESFYGNKGVYDNDETSQPVRKGGFSRLEIIEAIKIYLEDMKKNGHEWGGGDSMDRERVREILQPSTYSAKEEKQPRKLKLSDIPASVKAFMPEMQQKAIVGSEEHWGTIKELKDIIEKMPSSYQTENIPSKDKMVYLHYFYGGSDWYIVEKDREPEQLQAFGYAILNGDTDMAEWGYVNIEELKETNKVDLDFYFDPIKFGELMADKKQMQGEDEVEAEGEREYEESAEREYAAKEPSETFPPNPKLDYVQIDWAEGNYSDKLPKKLHSFKEMTTFIGDNIDLPSSGYDKHGISWKWKDSEEVEHGRFDIGAEENNPFHNNNIWALQTLGSVLYDVMQDPKSESAKNADTELAKIGKDGLELTAEEFNKIMNETINEYLTRRHLKDVIGKKYKGFAYALAAVKAALPKTYAMFEGGSESGDDEVDETWDIEKGKKLKKALEDIYPTIKAQFDIKQMGIADLKANFVFNNGMEGTIDLSRSAHVENYNPPAKEPLDKISNRLLEAIGENKPETIKGKIKPAKIYVIDRRHYKEYADANKAMRREIDGGHVSDMPYEVVFEDGESIKGSIDLEPQSFWKGNESPFTWHLQTFYGNIAAAQPKGTIITQEDIDWARNLMVNYDLGEPVTADAKNIALYAPKTDINSAPAIEAKMNTKKGQFEVNAEIKELIKQKGSDRSKYSADELAMLKLYSGDGGLIKQGTKGAGILDQFYTPPEVISRMWGLALKYGFKFEGANVLEPSCSVGRFFDYIPKNSMVNKVVGYDTDSVAATICQLLYPKYDIINASFETIFFQGRRHIGLAGLKEPYDLVIGNPPYMPYVSEYAPLGEKAATGALTMEMYFMMRGVDVLKAGGLLVMIIPSSFMNNKDAYNDFKEKLIAKAELLTAYRCPSGTFDRTDVTADILVLRKRGKEEKEELTPAPIKSGKKEVVYGGVVNKLDDFKRPITDTFVDGMTSLGSWAIMNPTSFQAFGTGLGTGKGQKYQKRSNGDWVKIEVENRAKGGKEDTDPTPIKSMIKKPTKQGQICKIINPKSGENPMETYIITENLSGYGDDDVIYVVSITDLMRNQSNPTKAPRKAVKISELSVVAEDLTSYVESWNK